MYEQQCRNCQKIYSGSHCPRCGTPAEPYTGGYTAVQRKPKAYVTEKQGEGRSPYSWIIGVSLAAVLVTFVVCLVIFLRLDSPGTGGGDTPAAETALSLPTFSHASGKFDAPISLQINNPNGKGTVYYTTNGQPPDEGSQIYTAPITLGYGTTTVMAIIVDSSNGRSGCASAVYVIEAPEPSVQTVYVPSAPAQEQTESEPAAEPNSGSAVLYGVYVGSFASRSNAESAVAAAKQKGFQAFVSPAQVNGKTMYRVQIGAYRERANAQAQLAQAQKSGYPDAFVAEK